MTFFAFGVNHLRAPLRVRETFALEVEGARKIYRSFDIDATSEFILLSTCNRTEAYLFGSSSDVERIQSLLAEAAGMSWPVEHAFLLQDEDAVRHVLEVAAGLKSLVLGDAQIFSQLKEAYRVASEEQRVGTTVHRLMHTAFRTAKRVINETDLSTGAASIPYQAVEVARAHFQNRAGRSLSEVSALVIGTGSMGRLAGEALRTAGVHKLAFTNRSEQRAAELAGKYSADVVRWSRRHTAATSRDLVIVATSADRPVIKARSLRPARSSETLFFDISVPRNVEPAVEEVDGVAVIDMDELSRFVQETEDLRKTAVPRAREIVHETLSEFVSWVFHHQALQPAIQAIADTFERIREQEVNRHHTRFEDVDREELDRITRSIIQKILAVPIVRLKSVDPESIDFVRGVQLLNALFRREMCEDDPAGALNPEGHTDNLSDSRALSDRDLREILRRFVREGSGEIE